MRFVYFADNANLNKDDKVAKLRPLIDLLKMTFMNNSEPCASSGCKQFLRGKPTRFEYKVWCFNTKNGHLVNFEVYQGTIATANKDHEKDFGKAATPMLQIIKELSE